MCTHWVSFSPNNTHSKMPLHFVLTLPCFPLLCPVCESVVSSLTEQDVDAFARLGAYDCLLSGTTCVWDHYYFGEAIAKAARSVGLCAVVAPTLQVCLSSHLSPTTTATTPLVRVK